jgi:hypothetical protein
MPTGFPCRSCGQWHEGLPFAYGSPALAYWNDKIAGGPSSALSEELCVIEGEHFFVRARIVIPVVDGPGAFEGGVWVSLSHKNFLRTLDLWEHRAGRARSRTSAGCPPRSRCTSRSGYVTGLLVGGLLAVVATAGVASDEHLGGPERVAAPRTRHRHRPGSRDRCNRGRTRGEPPLPRAAVLERHESLQLGHEVGVVRGVTQAHRGDPVQLGQLVLAPVANQGGVLRPIVEAMIAAAR